MFFSSVHAEKEYSALFRVWRLTTVIELEAIKTFTACVDEALGYLNLCQCYHFMRVYYSFEGDPHLDAFCFNNS